MSDPLEFVKARLAEEEQVARAVAGSGRWCAYLEGGDDGWAIETDPGGDPCAIIGDKAMTDHIARHDPARVLAEVEAKRRIIAECEDQLTAKDDEGHMLSTPIGRRLARRTIVALAMLDADHLDFPDLDPAWRA